jgi:hypothetical protein
MPFANDCLDKVGVCPNRLWTLSMGQCAAGDKLLQLIDPLTGELIDLTKYGIVGPQPDSSSSSSLSSSSSSSSDAPKHGVQITARDRYETTPYLFQLMAKVLSDEDAKNGIVYLPLTATETGRPGVFVAQAAVYEHGTVRRILPFWFELTPNLELAGQIGPITIAEVRMAMRDVCPEANFLIDAVEFNDEEVAWAIRRPIDYWNETPPPVAKFSASNFPYRYHWVNAAIGELLVMAAIWMHRNSLDYSAAGLSVKDMAKWADYMKIGQDMKAEWKDWAKNKKIEINIDGGFSSLGGYRYAIPR